MARQTKAKKTVRRRHSEEFKTEALALAKRIGVPAAAKELDLHESQLYGWRSKARARTDRSDLEQQQATEIARLKRKLAEREVPTCPDPTLRLSAPDKGSIDSRCLRGWFLVVQAD